LVVLGLVPAAEAQVADGAEADFAARVTGDRRNAGLGALTTQADLVAVARNHSAAMAASSRLYHNTLLGQEVKGWLLVAENVGVGSSVDQIHRAMMASPPHRADILDARFDGIGIGVVQSGTTMWVTQVFRRSAGDVPPAPAPAPPAAAPQLPVTPPPAPAPPPLAPPAGESRSKSLPRAARQVPAAPTTTAVSVAAPTTTVPAPATTAPVTTPPQAGLHLDTLAASSLARTSSLPPTPRPDLGGAGLLAATLLWAVAAGAANVAARNRPDPARG